MKNRLISLYDIVKLNSNPSLSEKYLRYVTGLGDGLKYRNSELLTIRSMLDILDLDTDQAEGFIYSYVVPQFSKEFDLLKISANTCIDIELKSCAVPTEQIKKQLIQNRHYLNILGKDNLFLFTYINDSDTFLWLCNDELEECSPGVLHALLCDMFAEYVDLDDVFQPKNVLVSPLNSPKEFLEGNYLLTEHQSSIKQSVLACIHEQDSERYMGITGGPGTGKTLLVYDLARQLSSDKSVLVIHSGMLCAGHDYLNTQLSGVRIIPAKELKYGEIQNADVVIVDEAQRLYENHLGKILGWVEGSSSKCIFSFDEQQRLSQDEFSSKTVDIIKEKCADRLYRLTNKIRTNKELSLFITCLMDLSKFQKAYTFPNVRIIYEPDDREAVRIAKSLAEQDYTYISYTGSFFDPSLDFQEGDNNTHEVIGQEFDGVCMILNKSFYYDGDLLQAKWHPSGKYLYERLLYQGLTRVRSKIALIVTDEALLEKILTLFC